MTLQRSLLLVLVVALVVSACDSEAPSDGDAGSDGAVGTPDAGPDAGPLLAPDAGADAGVSWPDAGADAGPIEWGDAGADPVARCLYAAETLGSRCPADPIRACYAEAFATFCADDARPGLFAEAMNCLRAHSSSTDCRTFGDPSGAAECVAAVYEDVESAEVDAAIARIDDLCDPPVPAASGFDPPLYALSVAQLTSLGTCLDAATDCAAAVGCVRAERAAVVACEP